MRSGRVYCGGTARIRSRLSIAVNQESHGYSITFTNARALAVQPLGGESSSNLPWGSPTLAESTCSQCGRLVRCPVVMTPRAQVISYLWREIHLPQERLEARVGAYGVKLRCGFQRNQPTIPLLVSLLEE